MIFIILTTLFSLNSFAYTKQGTVVTVIGSGGRLSVANTNTPPIQANMRAVPTSKDAASSKFGSQSLGKSISKNTVAVSGNSLGYIRQGGVNEGADGQYCRVKGFKDKDGYIKPDLEVKCGTISPEGITASCSKDGLCSLSRVGN